MDRSELWQKVLDDIKKDVTPAAFNSFISRLSLRDFSEEPPLAHLEAETGFACNIIKNRYIPRLNASFRNITGKDFRVMVKTPEEYKEFSFSEPEPLDKETAVRFNLNTNFMKEKIFDPKYTFDNFIVGESNNLAHAACFAVAQSPSDLYNPLFIYGNSGLGKTHLLHATGIYLLQHNNNLKILYVSSETFANDYIKAIHEQKMMEFKRKYRRPDVLLIDDVQFFEKKEGIQEEFFHTFNDLYDRNRQIILSGDRPPNKLNLLQERLRSRFAWNMITEIKAPDYETRVAILMKKAELSNVELTEDIFNIIYYIAERIPDNVRLIEGAFNRVISAGIMLNIAPDLAFAKRILTELADTSYNITPEKIKTAVCKHYKIKISDLDSDTRKSSIAYPRQIAMYLCRTMTDYSLPKIGLIFGNKHYSTVKYACDKIEDELKMNKELRDTVEQLKEKINS
ncbi:MAG: chromosomal replication initiator protein DnaA [Clostridia bacterium]|nr:chromosomal replication initiator protein DnaA [Clostridia bacterium]